MSDNHRILKAEFMPLSVVPDNSGGWEFQANYATDYRPLQGTNNQYWVSEHKLDLSGYTMEDLTTYFRDSFEQRGGMTFCNWNQPPGGGATGLDSYSASGIEVTLISSVPLSDGNLASNILVSSGFIPPTDPLGFYDFGNFDRTHIIHGRFKIWSVDSTFSGNFDERSGAYCVVLQQNDFSSLEPTAADALYCYRLFGLPESLQEESEQVKLDLFFFPPMRILLGAEIDKEPELEYMMRLKRSYELANQV